jgi:hypothetical protein
LILHFLDIPSTNASTKVSRAWREAIARSVNDLHPSHFDPASLIKLFPNLSSLSLARCTGSSLLDSHISEVSKLTKLTYLSLRGCSRLTTKGLAPLSSLTALRYLDITGCKLLRCDSLSVISHFTQLERLDADKCEGLRDTGLQHLSALVSLKELSLSGCIGVQGSGLEPAVANLGQNLSFLNLSGLQELEDCHLVDSLAAVNNLDTLILDRCSSVEARHLSNLSSCLSQIKTISLMECSRITNSSLEMLEVNLPNLQSLVLDYCFNVGDDGLASLSGLHHLTRLSARGLEQVRGVGFESYPVGGYCALEVLDLSECRNVSPAGAAAIAIKLTGLKELSLRRCGISDRAAWSLSSLSQLQSLCIAGSAELTCDGVAAIAAKCTKLKTLDVSSCANVGNGGVLAVAANLPELLSLNLCGCNKIEDVCSLVRLKKLVELNLAHTSVRNVSWLAGVRQLNLFGCNCSITGDR